MEYANLLTIEYKSFDKFTDKISYINKIKWFNSIDNNNKPWHLINDKTRIFALLVNADLQVSYNYTVVNKFTTTEFGVFIIRIDNEPYFITKKEIIEYWNMLSVSYINEYKSCFNNANITNAIEKFKGLLYIDINDGKLTFVLPNVK